MNGVLGVAILGLIEGFLLPIVFHWSFHNRFLEKLEASPMGTVSSVVIAFVAFLVVFLGPLYVFDLLPVTKAGSDGILVFGVAFFLGAFSAFILGRYLNQRRSQKT